MVSNSARKLLPLALLLGAIPASVSGGTVPAPLHVDANYHGSCDPEIVWNAATKRWTIYYTARRSTRASATYVGTPIGVISSANLSDWRFDGYADFAEAGVKHQGAPDMPVTFWAPGIVSDGKRLHMFVTYKDNAVPPWGGDGVIRHYSAPLNNAVDGWTMQGVPAFNQPDPIDATLVRAGKEYRAYYRVGKGGGIQWSTSPNLKAWTNRGKVAGDVNTKRFDYQEAPFVWRMNGSWWMITDPHAGLAVYRSADGKSWSYNGTIMLERGTRPMDNSIARHPSVVMAGKRAFLVYHVEPGRDYAVYGGKNLPPEKRPIEQKKAVLQMAELKIADGKMTAERNAEITLPERIGN